MTNGAENSTKWLSRIYSLSLSLIKAERSNKNMIDSICTKPSHRLDKRFENRKSFQVSSEFKLNEGMTLSKSARFYFEQLIDFS